MTNSSDKRRVVITGQGVTSPVGTGVDKFWASLKAGRIGYGPAKSYPTDDLRVKIAAEIDDFEAVHATLPKHMAQADKFSQYAGAAAIEAVKQSGLEVPFKDGARASAIVGSGSAGLTTLEKAYEDLFKHNVKRTHPLTLLRALGSSAAAHLSIEYSIFGPVYCITSACSSATHSIGITYRMIRDGWVDVGLAGGTEASLNWGATRAWQALYVLSPEGCFPFSKNRNGTVLGEGGGIFVMEELEQAKARGANILAEVKGFGMSADGGDMVNPKVEGAAGAIREALDEAKLSPSDIDYINAHGTATLKNDVTETKAIKMIFGKDAEKVSISSTKSMHGHLLGGGGAVESVACLKAMEDNYVPATVNLNDPDPECDLDYTPNEGKSKELTYTMSNSLAFGGLNTVLIFGPDPS